MVNLSTPTPGRAMSPKQPGQVGEPPGASHGKKDEEGSINQKNPLASDSTEPRMAQEKRCCLRDWFLPGTEIHASSGSGRAEGPGG